MEGGCGVGEAGRRVCASAVGRGGVLRGRRGVRGCGLTPVDVEFRADGAAGGDEGLADHLVGKQGRGEGSRGLAVGQTGCWLARRGATARRAPRGGAGELVRQ